MYFAEKKKKMKVDADFNFISSVFCSAAGAAADAVFDFL